MSKFKYGDLVRNLFTSDDHPQHIGTFVKYVSREGIVNPGTYIMLTDEKGSFWELLDGDQVELVRKQQPASPGWMPIESAPKDGTEVLLVRYDGVVRLGSWAGARGQWISPNVYDIRKPTHWKPLPQPPQHIACEDEGQPQQGGCERYYVKEFGCGVYKYHVVDKTTEKAVYTIDQLDKANSKCDYLNTTTTEEA